MHRGGDLSSTLSRAFQPLSSTASPSPCTTGLALPGHGAPRAMSSASLPIHRLIPIPGIVEILYANQLANVSDTSFEVLAASIYSGQTGMSVPYLELVAHTLLVLSLFPVLLRIALRYRGTSKFVAVADSWELLPSGDIALRIFGVVVVLDILLATSGLVLMCVPIDHDGVFVVAVYTAHAILDNLPWVLCLHRHPPTRASAAASVFLVATIATARALAAAGQPNVAPVRRFPAPPVHVPPP